MSTRRRFLSFAGCAAIGAGGMPRMAFGAAGDAFTFLFFTDAHLEPELNAAVGTGMAFRQARRVKADFAINGGDHVFDVNRVSKARALQLYDLYGKTEQDLGLKVYHTVGNHDVFAVDPGNAVSAADPAYGKRLFEERFGRTYYAFEHKGVHFVVLDSVTILAGTRTYQGRVDAEQMKWLAATLEALPRATPLLVICHYPIVTAFPQYEAASASPDPRHFFSLINSDEVLRLLYGRNVLGVLQGHTHVNEQVVWRGIPFHTSGAVSGNWWQGTRMGTAEGYSVVEVAGGRMSVRYETYGFRAVDPLNPLAPRDR